MESLIELVAASFARHGIECPAGDLQLAQPKSAQTKLVQAVCPAAEPTALPEHNYGKSSQADPVP
jgi:hypothetical protein